MIVQTERIPATRHTFLVKRMAARPQGIRVADQIQDNLCGLEIAVRTIIFSLYTLLSRHEYTRIKFLCDDYPGIGFVIFEKDIVMGLVTLDHRVLEMQGVLLGTDHYKTHIDDIAHKQIRPRGIMPTVEITRHTAFQTLCLADIYHLTVPVKIHIDSGRIRQIQDLVAELLARTVIEDILPRPVGFYLYIETTYLIYLPSGRCQYTLDILTSGNFVRQFFRYVHVLLYISGIIHILYNAETICKFAIRSAI